MKRSEFFKKAAVVGNVTVLMSFLAGAVLAKAGDEKPSRLRWDIIKLTVFAPTPTMRDVIVDPGGTATATARPFAGAKDQSKIVLTGSGFLSTKEGSQDGSDQDADRATGGGTWETFDTTSGRSTGRGTYRVVSLEGFVPVPGTLFPNGSSCSFTTPTGITHGIR
jgi:hypothetical protein